MTSPILNQIADRVRQRLELDRGAVPLSKQADLARNARQPHDFLQAFSKFGFNVIAEVKRASPSEGDLAPFSDPVMVAGSYLSHGAAAVSILTERDYFKGSPEFLRKVRMAYPKAHLLMKDFVLDEYQIYRARAEGADAVLLILALLNQSLASQLMRQALDLGLTPLVEVHDEEEMKRALDLGAKLIGVNNRDLRTLEVSVNISERLAGLAPKDVVLISESGLRSTADLRGLSALGYRGFLVGSTLMKAPDPGLALSKLRGGL